MTAQRVGYGMIRQQSLELVPQGFDEGSWNSRHKHSWKATNLNNPCLTGACACLTSPTYHHPYPRNLL